MIFCIAFFNGLHLKAQFYKTKHYIPNATSDHQVDLGILYNPQPYLITNTPTTYHGNQNVYAIAYLPFIETEYNPAKPVQLFGSYYTTGIALASPRDPAKALYAPVHVVNNIPKSDLFYPFASTIPSNANLVNFKGPFNKLKHLNEPSAGFVNPVPSEYGITALETAQKFTKFSHEVLTDQNGVGWNGFDKDGLVPISIVVNTSVDVSYYKPSKAVIMLHKNGLGNMSVTREVIGHEITHGMIFHSGNYNQNLATESRRQLNEGFANVLGLAFSDWLESPNFESPHWNMYWETANATPFPFDDPKSIGFPNTYKGDLYKENWQLAGYDEHDNGSVLHYVVAMLNQGRAGHVDDKDSNPAYTVLPLIPGNKAETYKLVLRVFLKAFTEKLTEKAEYPDLRMASLAAIEDLGYPEGSHAYTQLKNAWDAVGVGPTIYNKTCVEAFGETLLNGSTGFVAQQGTKSPDPTSGRVVELVECNQSNPIQTFLGPKPTDYVRDWDKDNIYSEDNNVFKSQVAVSIHKFSQVARDWFKTKLGLNGMTGDGGFVLSNELSDFNEEKAQRTHITEGANRTARFVYPYKMLSACRDEIAFNYCSGVNFYAKFEQVKVMQPSTDWYVIHAGLLDIFTLAIKKDFEKKLQNPGADNIRTLYEDMSDPALLINFENPLADGRPVVYHGQNWNAVSPWKNASILKKFFDLLVQGTDDDGYKNGEPDSPTYFVFKVEQDLIVKVLWAAFKDSPVDCSLYEFRDATLKALHGMGMQYDGKSKEHIAFYDAWAAVLGLPDYASTLKYEPVAGSMAYPWTVKVGAEVEYPLYESQRLFEVSKSPKFNPNEFPVHQFVSNAAPDLATSMVYGLVNLEPGQTYYIHSRLSNAGDPRDGCAVTPDPAFCESLKAKKKWAYPYEFITDKVAMVSNVTPLEGEQIPAWDSPLSWVGVPGARGGALNITDNALTMSSHIFPIESFYDADQTAAVIQASVALSKEKKYTHSIAPYQKLGSEWAVHVLPNGSLLSFTDAEIEAFPYLYGPWTPEVMFETDLPKIVPGAVPANGEHISLLAPPFTLTADKIDRADEYQFEYKEPYHKQAAMPEPAFGFLISNVPAITDLQEIKWAFTPVRKADTLFIPQDEMGATEWRSFVADMSLVPKPVITSNICFNIGDGVTIKWEKVEFATHYHYVLKEHGTGIIIAEATTDQLTTPTIANASNYPAPGKYVFEVSAGYKNSNGQFFFGPKASLAYGVRPPAPTAMVPDANNNVPLGPDNAITFKWQPGADPNLTGNHTFRLFKEVGNGVEGIDGFAPATILGNQITVPGLEFNTNYIWEINNLSTKSSCPSVFNGANFRTEDDPEEFDLGFTVMVEDHKTSTGTDIVGTSLTYKVKVTRPDGTVDFLATDRYSNADSWLQVGFTPGEPILFNGDPNGQLTDQTGDYIIELEILTVCDNCSEPAGKPEITIIGKEYKKKVSESDWTLNEEFFPIPQVQTFPGRVVGTKKTLVFHYELP
ncbi:M4 family metallopeptidase [Dyadobacter pollutisoli]|uniref:M4 family metallopeptidase n=1 Tax=Dyadobacter pollutisoli TaxID=2910158 RepID=A0A9E8NGG2_9BACT|nr:M4 family metallopeptidase [Dyadobacter pollutisoli]WAC14542.1 M4 family metallopeptidase [Dyadobacter pollutisoli]